MNYDLLLRDFFFSQKKYETEKQKSFAEKGEFIQQRINGKMFNEQGFSPFKPVWHDAVLVEANVANPEKFINYTKTKPKKRKLLLKNSSNSWDFYFSEKHLKEMKKNLLNKNVPGFVLLSVNGKAFTDKCLPGRKPRWDDALLIEANVINSSIKNPDALLTFEIILKKKKKNKKVKQ